MAESQPVPCKWIPDFKYFLLLLQICNVIITIAVVLGPWNEIRNKPSYIWTAAIVTVLVVVAILVLKLVLIGMDKTRKTDELVKGKRNLLIGYGGIALCGIVPQIFVICQKKPEPRFTCCLICNLIPIALIILFLLEHFQKYQVNRLPSKHYLPRLITISIHILLVFTAFFLFQKPGIYREWDFQEDIFFIHLVYTTMFSFSSAEFVMILRRGISWKNGEVGSLEEQVNLSSIDNV